MKLLEGLHEINKKTAESLWMLADAASSEGLIFPEYRRKQLQESPEMPGNDQAQSLTRFSEQEARFLYGCHLRNDPEVLFSLETPTNKTFGKGRRSALIDLSIYQRTTDGDIRRRVNVEFKFGTARPEHIEKDILKFLKEDIDGVWFHVLARSNKKAVSRVLHRLAHAFSKYEGEIRYRARSMIFAFCAMDRKELFETTVVFEADFLSKLPTNFDSLLERVSSPH